MRALSIVAAAALCLACSAVVKPVWACGGTFCDNPGPNAPLPMPVDQSGENVVFTMDGGYVEAHVQIQYTGDPERFAWLVPMQTVPEVSVGSQLFFQSALNATVPTYGVSNGRERCGGGFSGGSPGGFGCSSDFSDGTGDDGGFELGSGGGSEGTGTGGYDPPLVAKKTVGSFEVVILQPSSAAQISTWLNDNGYLDEPEAPPILDDYISRGFVFVAVKLQAGAGLDEIHPLVFRFAGDEPCIPLKLTRVAATPDMGVRAFFFGDRRFVPTGTFKHITLNDARIDWLDQGRNYTNVVSKAADELGADGRAFVTEYAGTSAVINTTTILSALWSANAFETATAMQVVPLLEQQGLLDCDGYTCTSVHPLIPSLLEEHFPPPGGVDADEFYNCVDCYIDEGVRTQWNGPEFAAELDALVIAPAKRAVEIVQQHPTLTRLFTVISPEEMTEDPMFAEVAVDVPGPTVATARTATLNTCNLENEVILPDGREVRMQGTTWPAFAEDTPFAESIEQYDETGTLVGRADNGSRTTAAIDAQNVPFVLEETERRMADTSTGCAVDKSRVPANGLMIGAAFALALVGRRRLRRR